MGESHSSLAAWVCGGNDLAATQRRNAAGSFAGRRTSKHATFRVRCADRATEEGKNTPVKLVVFDFDETITLATFMTETCVFSGEEKEVARTINFESPWLHGSRLSKLKSMLGTIVAGQDGQQRALAVLTNNSKGVEAVLNMLRLAGLDNHFQAIWTLPKRRGYNGAYKDMDGHWKFFDPPLSRVKCHKADVLQDIARNGHAWFPQLQSRDAAQTYADLLGITRMESIVLVDDQRLNFQSDSGSTVLRYAKVPRYDSEHYYDMGVVKNMGGLGAHDDADYETLKRFIEDPWMCKETFQIRCQERNFEGHEACRPVKLVVFDFDETLTLATFMPYGEDCTMQIGWKPDVNDCWSEADLLLYNFESPWVAGSRIAQLRLLLEDIVRAEDEFGKRALAVLTHNHHGAVAVLNLLLMAQLAQYFVAIWDISDQLGPRPDGVFQQPDGRWQAFSTPCHSLNRHKADVLQHVADAPAQWFPQLKGSSHVLDRTLFDLRIEDIVLVDDERANLRTNLATSDAKVMRYCKVARYDENYRDCGLLNQMGGIGAHSDSDYNMLKAFLAQPWDFPYPGRGLLMKPVGNLQDMIRSTLAEEEPAKLPRRRLSTS
eukprot:TRINITY_DN60501_c0_g1_i1.p1 TRINITY_DN60501_c0_g1~~TRINITY_DN60501_c0_g1_i1.p1  ORF type:complete len:615 (+),score=99.78 TRINITY_DN60501_c0_g1_i1:42-1847(+)